jgi:hypothetical protein
MKKLFGVVCILLLSAIAMAQTDATGAGGSLASGFSNKALSGTSVIAFYNNGDVSPAMGTVNIQTPALASGTLSAGGTFAAGGSFIVQITSVPQTFNGTFNSATWSKITLANGTHSYTLTGTLTDVVTGETGAFVLLTNNIGSGNFNAVISISSFSVSMN